jgi:hypothetical protein
MEPRLICMSGVGFYAMVGTFPAWKYRIDMGMNGQGIGTVRGIRVVAALAYHWQFV